MQDFLNKERRGTPQQSIRGSIGSNDAGLEVMLVVYEWLVEWNFRDIPTGDVFYLQTLAQVF